MFNLASLVLMKRESIDLLPCQHMQVYSPHISISIVEKPTIGVLVVILKWIPGAMVNASGSWPDADQFNSMSQSQVTIRCVIASFQLTHLSVMVLTSTWLNGFINITEVSGVCGESPHSGVASGTGVSLSTSETAENANFYTACFISFI